ncbi:MAG: MerR family transcriptional regulator [Thermodesulfovibrio sp.]|nr:MerR family transcriptional regulator [Thermodesulfovibrio sp.]
MHNHAVDNPRPALPLPDKLFYKIGEVSRITGIESYVLRYWETEFPFLKPRKNKSGQRVYTKKELELILQVKKMLYQERYTIEGVRKRFGEGAAKTVEVRTIPESKPKISRSQQDAIGFIRKKLQDILNQIR